MATFSALAAHLDVSTETVRQLKQRGVFPAARRGDVDIDACRVAYIRHLRERAAGRSAEESGESIDLKREQARGAKERADRAAMENAQMRGELAAPADITNAVVGLIELSKGRLMRVPARVAPGNPELRTAIADAIEEALEDLSLARVEEDAGADPAGGDDEAAAD